MTFGTNMTLNDFYYVSDVLEVRDENIGTDTP